MLDPPIDMMKAGTFALGRSLMAAFGTDGKLLKTCRPGRRCGSSASWFTTPSVHGTIRTGGRDHRFKSIVFYDPALGAWRTSHIGLRD